MQIHEANSVKMAVNKTARIARLSGQQKFQLSLLLLHSAFLMHFSRLLLSVRSLSVYCFEVRRYFTLCSRYSKYNIRLFSDDYVVIDFALG